MISLKTVIEALLIASDQALSAKDLVQLIAAGEARLINEQNPQSPLENIPRNQETIRACVEELNRDYQNSSRAFSIIEHNLTWRIFSKPDFSPWLQELFPEKSIERLSHAALETLALIAYRQPITKASIEAVRGVSCDATLQKLLDRDLIYIAGRATIPGRPLLYEITPRFYEYFGIRHLNDLPNAQELRQMALPTTHTKPVQLELTSSEHES